MSERQAGTAPRSFSVPLGTALLLALALGVAPRSWALPEGTFTGHASQCIIINSDTGELRPIARLETTLEVTVTAVNFLSEGLRIVNSSTLSVRNSAFNLSLSGFGHESFARYTPSPGPEVAVTSDEGLFLTCSSASTGLALGASSITCKGSLALSYPDRHLQCHVLTLKRK